MLLQLRRNRALTALYMIVRDLRSYFQYIEAGSFSQYGEDKVIASLFSNRTSGFYIDIGASHPFRINNTYRLYRSGWFGVAVDPIPHFKWLYRLWRPRDTFLNCGVGERSDTLDYYELLPSVLSSFDKATVDTYLAEERAKVLRRYEVDVMEINDMLEQYAADCAIDFMSVDVEGLDFTILSALDFERFAPNVICVEYNSPEEEASMLDLLCSKGYEMVERTDCNLIMRMSVSTGVGVS